MAVLAVVLYVRENKKVVEQWLALLTRVGKRVDTPGLACQHLG